MEQPLRTILNERISCHSVYAVCFFGVLLLQLMLVGQSAADDKEDAKQLFDDGKALFMEKKYEAAIESFKASLEKYPTYNGYFNLANCYTAVLRYGDALAVVAEMRKTLGPSEKPEMRQKFEEFETSILAVVGKLRIDVAPEGAAIIVDGEEMGTAPLYDPMLLGPGYHEVIVRKAGFEKETLLVEVKSEQDTSITIALEKALADLFLTVDVSGALVTVDDEPMGKTPLSQALKLRPGNHVIVVSKPGFRSATQSVNVVPGAKTALSLSLEPIIIAPVGTTGGDMPVSRPQDDGEVSPLFWALLSGTVVTVVMGGIFWGLAGAKARDFDKNNQAYVDAPSDDAAEPYDGLRLDDRKQGMAYEKAAIGLSTAAGILAAASATVFVLERRKSSSKKEKRAVAISPGGLSVRF